MIIVRLNETEYRLYSEFQKEFGVSRKIKASLGKIRRDKIVPVLDRAIIRGRQEQSELMGKIAYSGGVNNPQFRKKAYQKARDLKTKVVGIDPNLIGQSSSVTINLGKIPKEALKDGNFADIDKLKFFKGQAQTKKDSRAIGRLIKKGKGINRSLKKGDMSDIIVHTKKNGDEFLGHEVGHIMNAKNPKTRKTHLMGTGIASKEQRMKGSLPVEDLISRTSPSLRDAAKDIGRSRYIVQEERNASKNALELLKESGATKEELKKAKKNLETAEKTYRIEGRNNLLAHLRNKVQIPSRRGNGWKAYEDIQKAIK